MRLTAARPIPDAPPVTTATLSFSRWVKSIQFSPIAKKTFLVSVNDRGASGPSSRPSPDCLNPPKGVLYRTEECELTERLPDSTARDTRIARDRLSVHIDPDKPYGVSLAKAIPSASSSNGSTVTTGPK